MRPVWSVLWPNELYPWKGENEIGGGGDDVIDVGKGGINKANPMKLGISVSLPRIAVRVSGRKGGDRSK